MKLEHNLISNLHEQSLVSSIVILFMICESEKYYVSGLGTGHVGVGLGNGSVQVKRSSRRESIGDFFWCFPYSWGGGVIK